MEFVSTCFPLIYAKTLLFLQPFVAEPLRCSAKVFSWCHVFAEFEQAGVGFEQVL